MKQTDPNNNQRPDNGQPQTNQPYVDQEFNRGHANPLGSISNYVVSVLHSTLKGIRDGAKTLADFQEEVMELVANPEVATSVENLQTKGSTEVKKLALLELILLKNALHHHNNELPEDQRQLNPIPAKLTGYIATLANALGEIPFLTYDLVVRANTDKVTRTFTGFEHEVSFYQDHERIEKLLDAPAKNLIEEMAKIPPDAGLNKIDFAALTQKVKDLRGNLESSLDILLKVTSLDRTEFNIFRRYFYSPEKEEYPGPSGYFSGNLTALINACLGMELGRANSIMQRRYLYPRCDLEKLDKACDLARRGLDLNSLSKLSDCPQEFKDEVLQLNRGFQRWLSAHRAGVRKNIGEIYDSNQPGTGENPAKALLDGTIECFKQACHNLKPPPAGQNGHDGKETRL